MARRGGSIGSSVQNFFVDLIWFVLFSSVLLAFIKVNEIKDFDTFYEYTKIKSKEVQACVEKSVEVEGIQCSLHLKIKNYHPNTNKVVEKKENKKNDGDSKNLLESLGLQELAKNNKKTLDSLKDIPYYEENVPYNRKEWDHWKPVDKNHKCWNIREEIMSQQGNNIVYLDKEKQKASKGNACSIGGGEWVDPFSGETITSPAKIDIDHIVPLKVVAMSGGQSWDKKKKAQYANDPDVLILTSSSQNREKGAKTPSQWMPKDKKSHCLYATKYTNVVKKYDLGITKEDRKALSKALSSCK